MIASTLAMVMCGLTQKPAAESQIKVFNDPTPPRKTAISARLGIYGTGVGVRHHVFERVSVEFSGFALFGPRGGQFSSNFELRLVVIRRPKLWLHIATPVVWEHHMRPSLASVHHVPDNQVIRHSYVFAGIGPGVEIFVHPLVSLSMDLHFPFGMIWSPRFARQLDADLSMSMGVYVYFR